MTTSNGRSAETRRSGRVAQWLLGLLIVLAVAASILMVFTDTVSVVGSLAVIAALWAAVIGAILVTKFRRQAESAESKSRDLRLVYELQLEREIAARRQYELDVEATIRKEIGQETGAELTELKAQVLALRASLEQLLGQALPDQRTALPNEKLRELASGLGGVGSDTGYGRPSYPGSGFSGSQFAHDDSVRAAQDFAATVPAADAPSRHESSAFDASIDPNEMTEIIPVVTEEEPFAGAGFGLPDDSVEPTPNAETPAAEVPADDVTVDEVEVTEVPVDVAPDEVEVEVAEVEVAEVTPDVPVEQPRPTEAPAPPAPLSTPFSGGFYVGPQPQMSQPPQTPAPTFVDDTPTDEWAAQHAPAAAPAPAAESESAAGRHESGGAGESSRTVADLGGGRRRRETDHDAAHSAGLPAAELLNQLRQASSESRGGRRRRGD